MTNPDPTRAEQIESEWREAFDALMQREHGPGWDNPASVFSREALWYAYRSAAATRRDALEQEYLEAAFEHDEELSKDEATKRYYDDPSLCHPTRIRRIEAFLALRARRAKVDRVQAALDVLSGCSDPAPGGPITRARDLLTAELRERDGGK